jgi:hypothetical protein
MTPTPNLRPQRIEIALANRCATAAFVCFADQANFVVLPLWASIDFCKGELKCF